MADGINKGLEKMALNFFTKMNQPLTVGENLPHVNAGEISPRLNMEVLHRYLPVALKRLNLTQERAAEVFSLAKQVIQLRDAAKTIPKP